MKRRRRLLIAALVVLLPVGYFAMLSIFSRPPDNLGVHDGKLAPCPDSPNCVSTQATDEAHRMDPIPFTGTPEAARARLREILTAQPRAQIVTDESRYVHAEFTSFLFRFVDDVEFLIDPEAGVIHFRSASRVGYSDLGANRRRMQRIVSAFSQ